MSGAWGWGKMVSDAGRISHVSMQIAFILKFSFILGQEYGCQIGRVEPNDNFGVPTWPVYHPWSLDVTYLSCGQRLQPVPVNGILSDNFGPS